MYQTIILIGNLGKDPEMRFTPGGQPVTTLSVATNRRYTVRMDNQSKKQPGSVSLCGENKQSPAMNSCTKEARY